MPGREIEKYRMTPEKSGFVKNYRQAMVTEKLLREKTLSLAQAAKQMGELWKQATLGMKLMAQNAPVSKQDILDGQPKGNK